MSFIGAVAIAFIIGVICGGWFVKYTMDSMKDKETVDELDQLDQ